MPNPFPFDLFDDGQTFPSSLSPGEEQEVLSVCALELSTLENDEKRRTGAFFEVCERLWERLGALCACVREVEQRLPRQVGFFSGAEDRKVAAALLCRFLGILEEAQGELRAMDWSLGSVVREQDVRRSCLEAWKFRLLGCRGASEPSIEEPREALLARIEELELRERRLCADAQAVRQELQRFCRDTLPDFCNRADVFADLTHEGREGSPAALARLVGELRYALEHGMEQIRPYRRAEKEE